MSKTRPFLTVRSLAWAGLGLAALLITLLAWITSRLIDQAAQWASGGGLREAADATTRAALPEWLAAWIDPAWIKALQSLAQQLLHIGGDSLPLLGQGISLLNWLVWGAWALVMVALAFSALKVHLLMAPRP